MLHSTLPRAFLPAPSLCYLGGYYGENVHHYNSMARLVPLDSHSYPAALSTHHQLPAPVIPTDHHLSRSVSPSPLDLSLKPPPAATARTPEPAITKEETESIEVDDADDKVSPYPRHHWQTSFGRGDHLTSSYPSYPEPDTFNNNPEELYRIKETTNITYSAEASSHSHDYRSPNSSPVALQKYPLTPGKYNNRNNPPNYQQLLLTPTHVQNVHGSPMTPPSTPSPPQCPRRRPREHDEDNSSSPKTPTITTPKSTSAPSAEKRPKKKHARRLKFDEDTSSPVSGTVILGPDEAVVTGDIDPAFNIVEVTEEARAELAKIENRLGPYQCKLCRQLHEDAFQLAQHRCSRIAHVEYRCPECDKRFSCPANLASHRRWHKPRVPQQSATDTSPNSLPAENIPCTKCDAKFSRQASLRKHLLTQHPTETNNNLSLVNNNGDVNGCLEAKPTGEMA
uniref:C2H2-type domain-containing protein n=1 Tax=Bracon brevicornis TaxID=1563983 RepID=A0A6V7HLA1_9HYME